MKQLLQNLKNGETKIQDTPVPQVKSGCVLIKSSVSVVSAGTERMLVDFGKASYLQKAKQQPEKVKQVVDKIKTDGLQPTISAVKNKLDQPIPLGYSNVGVVIAVGTGVTEFKVGDRVVSNGSHAEIICVPQNLCAKIPENVKSDEAAFTVIASIGLQGVRLAEPTLGETFVVIGLGLIGLLTVQVLRAHGCKVIASDYDEKKVELAKSYGIDAVNVANGLDIVDYVNLKTKGRGADGVIITASTKSNDVIQNAAHMSRKRGRIVLIGVVGLELNRADFYEKELSFQVSCSYGPGRYDPLYEDKGMDYPLAFVRWTEQRNFEAVLDMMSEGKIDVSNIITNRYKFSEAIEAYNTLSNDRTAIGILLEYDEIVDLSHTVKLKDNITAYSKVNLAVIGAGNYTNQTLLPAMASLDVRKHTIVSSGGMNGVHVGNKHGFENTATSNEHIFENSEINSVIITTRHDSHANLVLEALKHKKHVFVEKPLCLTFEELSEIENSNPVTQVMVGFNRRFSPHTQKMKELLNTVVSPKAVMITVNAGAIPFNHWTQDLEVGGGRIIGEGCHFIDLARYIVGKPIVSSNAIKMDIPGEESIEDKVSIQLTFEEGSIATILYLANGDKSFPKERIEVFANNKILALDNFKVLEGYGWDNFKKFKTKSQDKGHANGIEAFVNSVKSGEPAIPFEEIIEVTKVTLDVVAQLRG
ncbi:bi-domain-containing oxidoreductase [Ureibacillus sp. NPDC094379]